MFKHLQGRIIQVLEALIVNDGVSNQLLSTREILRKNGFNTEIYTRYHDENCEIYPEALQDLVCDSSDILIYHYSGIVKEFETVISQPCHKIFVYHNITPKEFFQEDPEFYHSCERAREDLKKLLPHFDTYIGMSQYNIDELVELGIARTQIHQLPCHITKNAQQNGLTKNKEKNEVFRWLFVGRIVANKCQLELVEFFAKQLPRFDIEQELVLVGDDKQNQDYVNNLLTRIKTLNIEKHVKILGKISDAELIACYQEASLYISFSKHEGFGIPLIEACNHRIPVLALAHAAIPEVLQYSPGLADDETMMAKQIDNVIKDKEFIQQILQHQEKLIEMYDVGETEQRFRSILQTCLPKKDTYKTVSIVICTYNRADFLARALDYLNYQTNPNFEVIVIDGPSTDHTQSVIDGYQGKIKFAKNTQKNLSISRNMGIALASGDIVAFIDDDALPFDHWVEKILQSFNGLPLKVAGIGGATFLAGTLRYQVEDQSINSIADTKMNCLKSEFLKAKTYRCVLGTNSAFKRTKLLDIMGFDEQYDYFLDETDVCMRLQVEKKCLIHYQADLFLRHEFAQSHNRQGKLHYNWFSICKNIAYYIIKFNPTFSRGQIYNSIFNLVNKNYISTFKKALINQEITTEQAAYYEEQVYKGVFQGMEDAKNPKKLGDFTDQLMGFKAFSDISEENYRTSKPLHIVLLTTEFMHFTGFGGIGSFYYQLACELLQMGHQVTVVIPANEKFSHSAGNFQLYKIKLEELFERDSAAPIFSENMNQVINLSKHLVKLNQKNPIDIVDCAIWNFLGLSLFLEESLHSITSVLRLVTPFKVAAKTNGWDSKSDDYHLLIEAEEYLIKNANIVMPISNSIEKTILENYNVTKDHRWHLSPLGIAYWPTFTVDNDYDNFDIQSQHKQKLEQAKKKILFLGRLESRKNIQTFIAAAKEYIKSNPNQEVVFIVAGRDVENIIEKFNEMASLEEKNRIIFLGEVNDAEKNKLYAFSDVVVFPSIYESFGMVTLEAFVHGKPVIGARAGAIPEVIEEGESGLLFEADDSSDLAEKINLLLSNDFLYNKLAKGALARVRELSARRMTENNLRIYKKALEKAPQQKLEMA